MKATVLSVVLVSVMLGLGVALRADAGQADSLGVFGALVDQNGQNGQNDQAAASELSDSLELRALASSATVRVAGRNCTGVSIGSGFHLDGKLLTAQHLVTDAFDAKVDQPGPPVFSPVLRRSAQLDVVMLGPVDGVQLQLSRTTPNAGTSVLVAGHGGGGPVQLVEGTVLLLTDGAPYGFTGRALLLDGVVPEGFSGGPVLDHEGHVLGMVQGYEPSLDLTVAIAADTIEEWLNDGADGDLPSGVCS